jgi:hypothetical protein
MTPVARVTHRSLVLALLVGTAACAASRPGPAAPRLSPPPSDQLDESERIAHALSRLTFGARPGDAERVAAVGLERWIERQLHPETILDSAVTRALASIPAWIHPAAELGKVARLASKETQTKRDSSGRWVTMTVDVVYWGTMLNSFLTGKVVQAQLSERQLLEVLS